MDKEELILGCECMSLDHIAQMIYFPPKTEKEKNNKEENVIYFTVKTRNYMDRIIFYPSLNPRYWCYNFKEYCRFHILNRIPIAIHYLFNPSYTKEYGVLDCFDFQNKDLPIIKEFLSQLTSEETDCKKVELDNNRWRIKFTTGRLYENMPYWLNWEIQFLPLKILGRIRYALKYIFERQDGEQGFEIDKETAKKIKNLITAVENLNEENRNNK